MTVRVNYASRPGLQVPDLGAFHARMVEQGVRCVQEPKDVYGARLAQYLDPDGLAISVGEPRRVSGEGLAGASSART